jgi:dTDP-3-amino-3,4,6-trideoxy-alpha-D-glucose transaminase
MTELSTRVQANDFARQWEDIRADALRAVERVGSSGWLILGEEVRAFEQELAEWWGVRYAVGVASGLDALEIGLRSAGLKPGARVLTTPLTAFATTLAIQRAGARPVWCDVDDSGGLDLDQVDEALRADKTIRAVVPVHLYGHPLDPSELERLVDEHEVLLLEDCAQSIGAQRAGRATGLAGIAAATSLYPTKNLGAMGDAGVLLTGDPAVADRARRLRDYGQEQRYVHVEMGLNSRLDELHAAILRSALLPRLNGWLQRRAEVASLYTEALGELTMRPLQAVDGHSAHHLFPVELPEGHVDTVIEGLLERGVGVGRHYPFLCSDQLAVSGIGESIGALPVARRIAEREISLPIHPYLGDDEVAAVIDACRAVSR